MANKLMQNKLLTATICNNLDEISNLLQHGSVNINYIYSGPFNNKTLLEICCSDLILTTNLTTIQFLLYNGAFGSKALFYASCNLHSEIVQELVQHENVTNNPVLIKLIKYINKHKKNERHYLEIVKILLEKVDINLKDDLGFTAIYLSAKFDFKLLSNLFLEVKFNEIDLDILQEGLNKTARDIIQQNTSKKLPKPIQRDTTITMQVLLRNIRQRQEIDFLNNYIKYSKNCDTINEDNNILLLFASERGLINIIKYFLYIGVDSHKIFKHISGIHVFPLKYACVRGYYKIVELLLQYPDHRIINISLIELVKTKFIENDEVKINHKRCLELLLNNFCVDLSYTDDSLNTACYYAAIHQNSEITLMFLRKGGSLANKNSTGNMLIEFISPQTLEEHFNECIEYIKTINTYIQKYIVKINFNTFLPNENMKSIDQISCETQILQYISTKNDLKHLLHHPVIEMFLFIKWKRVKKFIFLNLLTYILFTIILFLFIYTETVMNSDMQIKWICKKLIKTILTVFWFLLVAREASQMFVFRLEYLKQYENWIEACLFLSTGVLLFRPQAKEETKNQIFALIIVSCSIELMLLSGRHFRIFFVSSMVLQTVSLTLFRWLGSYIILIVSFSFGFYFIFHDQRFFKSIYLSLFKTIVMITGEFELDNFKFTDDYIIGPILFILFVFLVNIVLLGVCTALAIHDIQLIINNAETKFQVMQLQHIIYWELALYTSRMYNFGNWFQKILKIKLFQEEPTIKIRIHNDISRGFQISDNNDTEIDGNVVKKIIARYKFKTDNCIKEYPSLNEKFFFELLKTINGDNYSEFHLDYS